MATTTCKACAAHQATIAAKDQTIIVLSDVVDDLRRQLASRPSGNPYADVQIDAPLISRPRFAPIEDQEPMSKLYSSDMEEEVIAAANAGVYGSGPEGLEAAAAALQAVGMRNTHIQIVK